MHKDNRKFALKACEELARLCPWCVQKHETESSSDDSLEKWLSLEQFSSTEKLGLFILYSLQYLFGWSEVTAGGIRLDYCCSWRPKLALFLRC